VIGQIANEVSERLSSEFEYPYRVAYGPELCERQYVGDNGIVFSRDPSRADRFDAPNGEQRTPRKGFRRDLRCMALVYCASTAAGATRDDHETECESVLDLIQFALDPYRATHALTFDGGRYLGEPEIAAVAGEHWPGVVYLLQFSVGRGVVKHRYDGSGPSTGSVDAFSKTSKVRIFGGTAEGSSCG